MKHIQARRNKAMGVQCSKDGETQADDEAEIESCNESDITQPEEVTHHDMHVSIFKLFFYFILIFSTVIIEQMSLKPL